MKLDSMMKLLINPPYGYRLVDKVKDSPKRNGDLFWDKCDGWSDVGLLTSVFDRDFVYARKIEIPEGWELIPEGDRICGDTKAYFRGEWEYVNGGGSAGEGPRNLQAYIRRIKPKSESKECCCERKSATETTLPNGTKVWLHTEDPAILLERIAKLEAENADLRAKLSGIPQVIGKNVEASFRDMLTKEGVMG